MSPPVELVAATSVVTIVTVAVLVLVLVLTIVHLSPGSSCGLLAYASARRYYNFPHICGQRNARASGRGLSCVYARDSE